MASIPDSVSPQITAAAVPEKPGHLSALVGLALAPPVIALSIGAFALSILRTLASEIGSKIEPAGASTAGSANPEVPHAPDMSVADASGIEP